MSSEKRAFPERDTPTALSTLGLHTGSDRLPHTCCSAAAGSYDHELPGGFGPRARAAQIPSSLGRAPPITLRAETEARSNQAGRENEL